LATADSSPRDPIPSPERKRNIASLNSAAGCACGFSLAPATGLPRPPQAVPTWLVIFRERQAGGALKPLQWLAQAG
jgi:hypothetical protein